MRLANTACGAIGTLRIGILNLLWRGLVYGELSRQRTCGWCTTSLKGMG